jgi:hypothetical protein
MEFFTAQNAIDNSSLIINTYYDTFQSFKIEPDEKIKNVVIFARFCNILKCKDSFELKSFNMKIDIPLYLKSIDDDGTLPSKYNRMNSDDFAVGNLQCALDVLQFAVDKINLALLAPWDNPRAWEIRDIYDIRTIILPSDWLSFRLLLGKIKMHTDYMEEFGEKYKTKTLKRENHTILCWLLDSVVVSPRYTFPFHDFRSIFKKC